MGLGNLYRLVLLAEQEMLVQQEPLALLVHLVRLALLEHLGYLVRAVLWERLGLLGRKELLARLELLDYKEQRHQRLVSMSHQPSHPWLLLTTPHIIITIRTIRIGMDMQQDSMSKTMHHTLRSIPMSGTGRHISL